MSSKLLSMLLLALSFALYYVVINPLYTGVGTLWTPEQSITSLRASSKEYDAAVKKAEDLKSKIQELDTEYQAINPNDKDKIVKMVPTSIDPVRLLSEVNSIGLRSNVALDGLSYSETKPLTGGKGVYTINFSVTTSYSEFKNLMRNFEFSQRIFTIKSVNFSSPSEKNGDTTFTVQVETYYIQ